MSDLLKRPPRSKWLLQCVRSNCGKFTYVGHTSRIDLSTGCCEQCGSIAIAKRMTNSLWNSLDKSKLGGITFQDRILPDQDDMLLQHSRMLGVVKSVPLEHATQQLICKICNKSIGVSRYVKSTWMKRTCLCGGKFQAKKIFKRRVKKV